MKKRINYKKTNIYNFLHRLYKSLKETPEIFEFCKLKDRQGDCDWEKMRIDYRKELLSTLIHEYLHYINPTWPEYVVIKEEKRIMNKMSLKQIQNLIINVADSF